MGTYREWLTAFAILVGMGVLIHVGVTVAAIVFRWLEERDRNHRRSHDDLLAARREHARRLTNERRGNPPAWWQ